jgi:hypothetical protein
MCVVIYYWNFVWNVYHSKKDWASYRYKYMQVFV